MYEYLFFRMCFNVILEEKGFFQGYILVKFKDHYFDNPEIK